MSSQIAERRSGPGWPELLTRYRSLALTLLVWLAAVALAVYGYPRIASLLSAVSAEKKYRTHLNISSNPVAARVLLTAGKRPESAGAGFHCQ